MSLIGYEVDKDWIPDAEKINAPVGSDYFAWRLGVSEERSVALWVFYQVNETADPLDTYLPVEYETIDIIEDISKYGYTRNVLPKLSIDAVETEFTSQGEAIADSIAGGFA